MQTTDRFACGSSRALTKLLNRASSFSAGIRRSAKKSVMVLAGARLEPYRKAASHMSTNEAFWLYRRVSREPRLDVKASFASLYSSGLAPFRSRSERAWPNTSAASARQFAFVWSVMV